MTTFGNRLEGVYCLNYEELMIEAYGNDLIVKEANLYGNKGRIKNNRVAIKKDIPTLKEKSCVLAEELGHFYTSVGDILDQSKPENRKQELKARLWAYNKQIGLNGILNAYIAGCQNSFEMAEFLDITEEFLNNALNYYKQKYGICVSVDNYLIYFEPNLGVMKIF